MKNHSLLLLIVLTILLCLGIAYATFNIDSTNDANETINNTNNTTDIVNNTTSDVSNQNINGSIAWKEYITKTDDGNRIIIYHEGNGTKYYIDDEGKHTASEDTEWIF